MGGYGLVSGPIAYLFNRQNAHLFDRHSSRLEGLADVTAYD